jgi:hypothetical protein
MMAMALLDGSFLHINEDKRKNDCDKTHDNTNGSVETETITWG